MAEEEEEELRFHPKCLYVNPTPSIDCAWNAYDCGRQSFFDRPRLGRKSIILLLEM
jgi:hypothetical protein